MEAENVDEERDVKLNNHINNNAEEATDGNIKADKQGWAEWSTAFQLRSLSVLEFGAGERGRSPEVEVPELPLCI